MQPFTLVLVVNVCVVVLLDVLVISNPSSKYPTPSKAKNIELIAGLDVLPSFGVAVVCTQRFIPLLPKVPLKL